MGAAAVKSSLLVHWSFKMLFVVLVPTSMMETFLCLYCIYLLTIWTIKWMKVKRYFDIAMTEKLLQETESASSHN